MGYTPSLFEWVLGPGEEFTSEPVFYYALQRRGQRARFRRSPRRSTARWKGRTWTS